jgi:hypothetical protein
MNLQVGTYKVSFSSPIGEGTGVVILDGGKARGGDTMMFYSGHYSEDGSNFRATIRVGKHSNVAGMQSVLGVENGDIVLEGTSAGSSAQCTGWLVTNPGVKLRVALTRIAD